MEWLESRVGDNNELIPLDEIQEEVWSKLSGDFMAQDHRMQQVALEIPRTEGQRIRGSEEYDEVMKQYSRLYMPRYIVRFIVEALLGEKCTYDDIKTYLVSIAATAWSYQPSMADEYKPNLVAATQQRVSALLSIADAELALTANNACSEIRNVREGFVKIQQRLERAAQHVQEHQEKLQVMKKDLTELYLNIHEYALQRHTLEEWGPSVIATYGHDIMDDPKIMHQPPIFRLPRPRIITAALVPTLVISDDTLNVYGNFTTRGGGYQGTEPNFQFDVNVVRQTSREIGYAVQGMLQWKLAGSTQEFINAINAGPTLAGIQQKLHQRNEENVCLLPWTCIIAYGAPAVHGATMKYQQIVEGKQKAFEELLEVIRAAAKKYATVIVVLPPKPKLNGAPVEMEAVISTLQSSVKGEGMIAIRADAVWNELTAITPNHQHRLKGVKAREAVSIFVASLVKWANLNVLDSDAADDAWNAHRYRPRWRAVMTPEGERLLQIITPGGGRPPKYDRSIEDEMRDPIETGVLYDLFSLFLNQESKRRTSRRVHRRGLRDEQADQQSYSSSAVEDSEGAHDKWDPQDRQAERQGTQPRRGAAPREEHVQEDGKGQGKGGAPNEEAPRPTLNERQWEAVLRRTFDRQKRVHAALIKGTQLPEPAWDPVVQLKWQKMCGTTREAFGKLDFRNAEWLTRDPSGHRDVCTWEFIDAIRKVLFESPWPSGQQLLKSWTAFRPLEMDRTFQKHDMGSNAKRKAVQHPGAWTQDVINTEWSLWKGDVKRKVDYTAISNGIYGSMARGCGWDTHFGVTNPEMLGDMAESRCTVALSTSDHVARFFLHAFIMTLIAEVNWELEDTDPNWESGCWWPDHPKTRSHILFDPIPKDYNQLVEKALRRRQEMLQQEAEMEEMLWRARERIAEEGGIPEAQPPPHGQEPEIQGRDPWEHWTPGASASSSARPAPEPRYPPGASASSSTRPPPEPRYPPGPPPQAKTIKQRRTKQSQYPLNTLQDIHLNRKQSRSCQLGKSPHGQEARRRLKIRKRNEEEKRRQREEQENEERRRQQEEQKDEERRRQQEEQKDEERRRQQEEQRKENEARRAVIKEELDDIRKALEAIQAHNAEEAAENIADVPEGEINVPVDEAKVEIELSVVGGIEKTTELGAFSDNAIRTRQKCMMLLASGQFRIEGPARKSLEACDVQPDPHHQCHVDNADDVAGHQIRRAWVRQRR